MSSTAFIAICSEEYLPYYSILYKSLKKHAPYADQILYFIGKSVPTDYDKVVNITDWYDKAAYSDTLTKICSLRPRVCLHAFDLGYEKVLHLGAKLEFFHEPWELLLELETHDAVGTPHITEPLPDDNKWPSNASVSFTGHLSTDLVGYRNTEQIRKFLTWYDDTLKTKCQTNGHTYLDQSYLNYLPFFCDNVSIFKHPGYNCAYWNCTQRELHFLDGKPLVKNNVPLVAFQYSGLDLDNPKRISKHQDRYEAEGDFLEFLEDYARRVKNG